MPERRRQRSADLNLLAASIADEATGNAPDPDAGKNQAAARGDGDIPLLDVAAAQNDAASHDHDYNRKGLGRVLAKPSSDVGLLMWVGRAGLAVSLLFGAILAAGSEARAATSSASFCSDAVQLQSWIEQGFQPGIDQYQDNPNLSSVKTEAAYLQKLTAEAPVAVQRDLSEWATFTEELARGKTPTDLAKEVKAASAAAERVREWLATKSGCTFTDAGSPSDTGIPVPWVIGGVFLGLVLLGGWVGSRSGFRAPVESTSRGTTSNSSSKSTSFDREFTMRRRCYGCNDGKVQCPACGGRRFKDVGGGDPVPCFTCNATGKVPHDNCKGTGYLD